MPSYEEFILNGKTYDVALETLEIAHSSFSKTYRIVRNAVDGVTLTLEDAQQYPFVYYPLAITSSAQRDDLDYGIDVSLGDIDHETEEGLLGDILAKEIDNVISADTLDEFPIVKYRVFSSADLTSALLGPMELELFNLMFTADGVAVFSAGAPRIANMGTGEAYIVDDIEMLRPIL